MFDDVRVWAAFTGWLKKFPVPYSQYTSEPGDPDVWASLEFCAQTVKGIVCKSVPCLEVPHVIKQCGEIFGTVECGIVGHTPVKNPAGMSSSVPELLFDCAPAYVEPQKIGGGVFSAVKRVATTATEAMEATEATEEASYLVPLLIGVGVVACGIAYTAYKAREHKIAKQNEQGKYNENLPNNWLSFYWQTKVTGEYIPNENRKYKTFACSNSQF